MLNRKSNPSSPRWSSRLYASLYALVTAIYRGRPVWMVSFSTSEANLSEGLRAACASTAMLVLGNLLHDPAFAWAAIGAFWTCLADAAGSNRARFASMMGFALLSTVCGAVTAFASGEGTVFAALAILAFTTLGAFGRIWGAATSQVTILAATACVVMVDRPMRDFREGAAFLGIYLAGCLFAVVLSLTVWRIHPFGTSRASLRAVYLRLADIAFDSARLLEQHAAPGQWATHAAKFRADARATLERSRKALANVPDSRTAGRETYDNLLALLTESEALFAYLIAVTGACEKAPEDARRVRRAARLLTGMGEVLRRIGAATNEAQWNRLAGLQLRLRRLARRLESALMEPVTLKSDFELVDFAPAHAQPLGWSDSAARLLTRMWSTLKANLSVQSVGLRHAARVGVTTTAGFLVIRALGLPFGYWATMATLLILQPSIAATWPRSIERAAGSIVGGVLAAAIGYAIHSPLGISLAVFPLVVATMALRPVSYSLFVLFLTPTFVLVADFATPGASEFAYALTRLGNNVLGCVLALLATFYLWPTREKVDYRAYLNEAVRANLGYLRAALASPERSEKDMERLRRAAGLGSNNAEEAIGRIRLEKLEDSMVDTVTLTVLSVLRKMAGTATQLRLSTNRRSMDDQLGAWIASTNADIEAALNRTLRPIRRDLPARDRLSSLEADAVGEIALMHRLLTERMREARG
ncbi:FUSC family protein [Paraburkholderia domus]|uniref:Integral membrane bound transporter domain-containing protein n=1 Tax=Paraburkholderia domus TaxID=2793075 RepID=A0A9N8N5A1_9BURK|nr:FUSC family protein [Paraburkholderia domus]MBK5049631.1 FUSC family protein [Burkholderia sp. R-70006]MBK5059807.1 FUSC family protein [Burkholderia sp. R-70199]MBK5121753.1 FUSC family protein [Burkholderia sp. R-69980]MBK5167269.1 FUSC family protein [Burkholderia sp. R-70211]MBK5180970.1 FUSC family protein [Burkholderia sp. R-69749]MCI0145829.1 FUSC family protein [Paraburkholderia sediminicola]